MKPHKKTTEICILFILTVAGYLIKYTLNVFLARNLTPEIYGEFSTAVKLLDILVLISLFGTNIGANRFLAKYLQFHQKESAADYIAWNLKLISITFSVMLMISIFIFLLMLFLHFSGIHHIQRYYLFVYVIWVTPIAAFATLLQNYLLCTRNVYSPTVLSQLILYGLQLIIFSLIFLYTFQPFNRITIATVLFSSFLGVTFITLMLINKEFWSIFISAMKKLNQIKVFHSNWLKSSLHWIANSVVFQVLSVMDLFIVYFFTKDKYNVGYYAAILTIVYLIWLLPSTLYQGIKPRISALIVSESGRAELQSLLNKANLVSVSIIVILSTSIIFFSKALLLHFGAAYLVARPALIILTLGVCLGGCTKISILILIYADCERTVLKIRIAQLILMFLLVIPATYFYDITGAAIATAIVACVAPIISIRIVRTRLGLRSIFI